MLESEDFVENTHGERNFYFSMCVIIEIVECKYIITRMTTFISSEAQNFVDGTDCHGCFLQTTENLILISLTEKILKIGP